MDHLIQKFMKDDSGAAMIEYALLAALSALATVTVIGLLGNEVTNTCNNIANKL